MVRTGNNESRSDSSQHGKGKEPELGGLLREPLSVQIAHRLANYIEGRRLRPGDMLPSENRLAAEFEVSRPVVREALRSLAGQGIVEIVNGKGAIIRPLDGSSLDLFFSRATRTEPEAIRQVMEVRKPLETQSARLAAERRTDAEVALIARTIFAMRENLDDLEAYADLDVQFHLILAEAARNKVMYYLIGSIRESLRDAVLEGLHHRRTKKQLERVQLLHEQILAEVKRQDPYGAERAMSAHFDDAVTALVGRSTIGKSSI